MAPFIFLLIIENSLELWEFRHISLFRSFYKLVSKVLKARLAKVIGKLVAQELSNFIRGTQLLNGVVALNVKINLAKVSKKECFYL